MPALAADQRVCNDPAMIHLEVLGQVAVRENARDVDIGGPRARALVAVLAFARGRVLAHDELLGALWVEPSPGLRSSLRAHISRLRGSALGPHLTGGRRGYALTADAGLQVDVWRAMDLADGAAAPAPGDVAWLTAANEHPWFGGAAPAPGLEAAQAGMRVVVRRALLRSLGDHPGEPASLAALDRLGNADRADPEVRTLRLTAAAAALRPTPPANGAHDDDRLDGAAARNGVKGLPAAFAVRRVDVPAPIAAHLPRPEEEFRLDAALTRSRLVTLAGSAGVGKTRLAVEWARGPRSEHREHVWFVRAGGSTLAHAIARAVGADSDAADGVIDRLRSRRGVLVIDGLEESPGAGSELLARILDEAPGVAALVTARRALGVPGESVQRVEALSPPDARALFALRGGDPAAPVAELDTLLASLGRSPLAVELAAAQSAQRPLAAILDALTSMEDDPPITLLTRAVDATIGLLSPTERATLQTAAPFYGPFTADSAAALGGRAADEAEFTALAGWGLLQEESDSPRLFRLPEIVRRRLPGAETRSDREAAAHLAWFAPRTLAAFTELTTSQAAAARRRLEAERTDIDAAFEQAVGRCQRAGALSIAAGLAWLGVSTGTQASILAMSRRAAALPGAAPAAIEAKALLARGFLAYQLGEMDEARVALDESVRFAGQSADAELVSLAHAFTAYLATLHPAGARTAAARLQRARVDLAHRSPATRSMVTLISAQVERAAGQPHAAVDAAREAGVLAGRAGHGWVALMSEVIAAKGSLDLRDPASALGHLTAALRDPGVLADPVSVLIVASVAAGAAAAEGRDLDGARIVGAVDAIGARYGFDPRANEPADFEAYRRRVKQGLTPEVWRDAYEHGAGFDLSELLSATLGLARPHTRPREDRRRKD